MMDFGSDGWNLPPDILQEFGGKNPFELGSTVGQAPVDPRLDVQQLLKIHTQFISNAELQDLTLAHMQFPSRQIPEVSPTIEARPEAPCMLEHNKHNIDNLHSFSSFQEHFVPLFIIYTICFCSNHNIFTNN